MPLYPQWYGSIGGILLFENTSLNVEWPDNATDVDTVLGGAAGVSPGPAKCTVTAENVIPVAGTDVDSVSMQLDYSEQQCEFKQVGSTKSVSGTFLIRSNTINSGVGAATTISFTAQSIGVVPRLE
jgi:hypothetical protein